MPRLVLRAISLDSPVEEWDEEALVVESFPFVVGRHPECSCHLGDPRVSRYHCSFFLQGEQAWVLDMNSSNGTYVNGRLALLPIVLHDGDELRIAASLFRVALSAGDTDASGRLVGGARASAAEAC